MAVTTTLTALPTPPQSTDPANFAVRADAFVSALDATFEPDMNAIISEINSTETNINNQEAAAALSAYNASVSELNAQASANFKGSWSSVTAYTTGQSVLGSDNAFYVALQNSTNQNPTSTTGYWKVNVALLSQSRLSSPLFEMPLKNSIGIQRGIGESVYTCASASTHVNRYGVLTSDAIDTPRFKKDGYLSDPSSTNLLLNSDTLSTQTVTVISGTTYTLSFYDTGSIVLSGAYSATLAGTAVFPTRVTLTFTATTTSLTLTVSGTVRYGQLEAQAWASSYIPTTSTSVTRALTSFGFTTAENFPSLIDGCSFSVDIVPMYPQATGGSMVYSMYTTTNERVFLQCINNRVSFTTYINGTAYSVASASGSITSNTKHNIKVTVSSLGVAKIYVNGVLSGSTSWGVLPRNPTLSTITYIGSLTATTYQFAGQISNFEICDFELTPTEAAL